MNNIYVTVSRILQRVVRYFNPLMRLVLGGRAHGMLSSRLMLLSFSGRKTGRSYTTPVSYVREGADLLVPGGGAWWKNLAGSSARVRLQGEWKSVTPVVIYEPDELSETLGRMLAANPAIALFTGIWPDTNGRPITESLDRERNRGFVVVRLHINNEDVSGSTITHEATATRRSSLSTPPDSMVSAGNDPRDQRMGTESLEDLSDRRGQLNQAGTR